MKPMAILDSDLARLERLDLARVRKAERDRVLDEQHRGAVAAMSEAKAQPPVISPMPRLVAWRDPYSGWEPL